MHKKSMQDLQRKSVDEFRDSPKTPIVIVLDNVRSMHNVGSVFRTADAFLLEAVFLCGYTPVPPHRDIHKTALGATETVKWKYFSGTAEAISFLKEDGYGIYAVEQVTDSILLNEVETDPGEKLAVVFGNEVNGVDTAILKECNGSIEIPQLGMKHSLNISVAAGIVLWELVRQRF
jgi:23S rRNA (guanosine2251-2'-O)-methyltransferase